MSSFMNQDEEDWQPPTEEELQMMRARQARSNKISKILGEYLLKGYRMLGTTCPDCDTILLRDRQQKDFCVACTEIDVLPDNKETEQGVSNSVPSTNNEVPCVEYESVEQVLNGDGYASAAHEGATTSLLNGQHPNPEPRASLTREHSRASQSSACSVSPVPEMPLDMVDGSANHAFQRIPVLKTTSSLSRTKTALEQKLKWATDELQKTLSVESSIQLCNLIKVSLETLDVLSKHQAGGVQEN